MNSEIINEYIDILEKKSGKVGKYQLMVLLNGVLAFITGFSAIVNGSCLNNCIKH